MKRSVVAAIAAACLTGCKGSAYWADRLNANSLYQRANKVRNSADCARLVPMEFGATFPVPVRDGTQRYFAILFYPLAAGPAKSTVATPSVQAVFTEDSAHDRCTPIDAGTPRELGPAMPAPMSMTRYYRSELRLYESLDRASVLFFQGAGATAEDRVLLSEYAKTFESLAEPGLLPYYYRLDPDFWEWLRGQTGNSIPKPSAL